MRFLLAITFVALSLPAYSMADFTFFNLEAPFVNAANATNQQLLYTETFSNTNLSPGDQALLPLQTLQFGQPLVDADSGLGFAEGLSTDLITVESIGTTNKNAGWALEFIDTAEPVLLVGNGIEIDVLQSGISSVGFSIDQIFNLGESYTVEVFDDKDNLVLLVDDYMALTGFVGVVADEGSTIGRLRINDQQPGAVRPFFADNIQIWQGQIVPEPASASIVTLLLISTAMLRRR